MVHSVNYLSPKKQRVGGAKSVQRVGLSFQFNQIAWLSYLEKHFSSGNLGLQITVFKVMGIEKENSKSES